MLLLLLVTSIRSKAQTGMYGRALDRENTSSNVANMASTYVPIESWIYPAMDRLAAAGYIQSDFMGLRPWTRLDCARLVAEAQEQEEFAVNDQAKRLVDDLAREFAPELRRREGARNREALVESLDIRSTSIIGSPLTDGYHNAQTLINDYGRPYGQGENLYAGVALRATGGPFAGYIRTELQQAAAGFSRPLSANSSIAEADFTPAAAEGPESGFTRGRVLEAYVSFAFHNNQISFGKQALWWGPSKGGPLLFSDNAEPFMMFRYDRLRPFVLPGVGRWLGPIRVQVFAGRLSGQQFVHVGSKSFGEPGVALTDQPFIHGQKISFKPTPNFEFSISRTVIFGGAGAPVTTASVFRSIFSSSTSNTAHDPGDRRSAVDIEYRMPKMRNWLTAYIDTFTDDEPFPLNYPSESAWSPGLYLARVPRLAHLDLRAEGYLTPHRDLFPGFYYFNVHYLSGYTNDRQLIGSWIGRESSGFQLWGTWWLSPRSSIQASVRHADASSEFLRGGSLRDIRFTADFAVQPDWQLRVVMQAERWRFPLFSANTTNNLTATFQLTYQPPGRRQ